MTLDCTRFGTIDFSEDDVFYFDHGMVGFPMAHQFLLISNREGSPFRWLQCVDEPSLAFLVTDPGNYVEDYAPELSDQTARELELQEETPRLVLTTVNIPKGRPEDMTLNLSGPVLVNLVNRRARQVVLEDDAYTTKYRVFQQADRVGGNVAA